MLSLAFLSFNLTVSPKNAQLLPQVPFRPVTSLLSPQSSFVQPDTSELAHIHECGGSSHY